jgi:predicted RNA binding protein YcfA (HicA-like mRNA interferase family)
MPKLYSSFHVLKILEAHGFIFISQRGSHIKLRKSGNPVLTVIVPADRKEIPNGTLRSILRQSQLSLKDFE